jgi:hypothetical protein
LTEVPYGAEKKIAKYFITMAPIDNNDGPNMVKQNVGSLHRRTETYFLSFSGVETFLRIISCPTFFMENDELTFSARHFLRIFYSFFEINIISH